MNKITVYNKIRSALTLEHKRLITKSVAGALKHCGADNCLVYVTVTDDAGIRKINAQHRGIDKATDCLSFPMTELKPGQPVVQDLENTDFETGKIFLGDVIISFERARAQGEEFGHGLVRELCYLTVHSALHLLGYDHVEEKAQMRAAEEEILNAVKAD